VRVAVYTEDGGELLGTLESSRSGELLMEPFDGSLRYNPESLLAELEWNVVATFTGPHADAESFLRRLERAWPERVHEVPDDCPMEDIWPGAANDPFGSWLRHHPNCPNPPGRKDGPHA
jgi:hypothetical protein